MWDDLLYNRQQRDRARWQTRLNNGAPTQGVASSFGQDTNGFFGDIVSAGAKVANKVGSFFGDIAKTTWHSAQEAVGTVKDIAVSAQTTHEANTGINILNEARVKLKQAMDAGKLSNEQYSEALKQMQTKYQEIGKKLQNDPIARRDAAKSAAAVGETFLNVATLGAGGLLAKGAKQTAELVAKRVATNVVKRTATGAIKTIGRNAAEGALWGAGYGVLQPIKAQGSDVTGKDLWSNALMGSLFGGGLGGATSLLDKNVRAGMKEIPGTIKENSVPLGQEGFAKIPSKPTAVPGAKPTGGAIDPMVEATAKDNAKIAEFNRIRKEFGDDNKMYDMLSNYEGKDPFLNGAAQYVGRSHEGQGIPLKDLFDEIGTSLPSVRATQAMNLSDNHSALLSDIRSLEKSTGQKGLYSKVTNEMKGMTEQEQVDYMGKTMINMRDNGVLLMDRMNQQSGYVPSQGSRGVSLSQSVDNIDAQIKTYVDAGKKVPSELITEANKLKEQFSQAPPEIMGAKIKPLIEPTTPLSVSDIAYKQTVDNGGVTINTEGAQPGKGFAYSPFKDTEMVVSAKQFTPNTVTTYMKQHADKLKQPGNHLGLWEDNGKIYLDISKVGDESSATLQGAMDAQQLAAFDLGKFQEIPLGKFDNGVYNALYEASNHPYLNQGQNAGASASRVTGELAQVPAGTSAPAGGYQQFIDDLTGKSTTRPALPGPNQLLLEPGAPKVLNPTQAKRQFVKTGEAPSFLNVEGPSKTPIALGPSTEEAGQVAVRATKSGQVKPLASNNAHISKGFVSAIRAVADDNTSSRFTATRTPEVNFEEAMAKRGGTASKEFQVAEKEFFTPLREHLAERSQYVDSKKILLGKFVKKYKINGKSSQAMRPYLEAADEATSKKLLDEYSKQFGSLAADGMRRLRIFWRADNKTQWAATNDQILKYAGEKRLIGNLGDTFVPRVYKRGGIKGFKDSVLDVTHAGMAKLNKAMNLETPNGYLSKETDNAGGVLRGSEGIPLNSEFTKPNTVFLSTAQHRTAQTPIGALEDPITSMMRWYDATSNARFLTEDIARGRTIQKAIQAVSDEGGDVRQMYTAFGDQINSIANKTSRFDRYLADTKTGNQFIQVASKLQRNISRSTILGSTTSAMAQTGQLPLVVAENGIGNFRRGMQDMFKYLRSKAQDPMDESALMNTRYPVKETPFRVKLSGRAASKATEIVAKPFKIIERAATDLAWRSSYNRVLQEGKFVGKRAIQEADRITAKIIGERSPGTRAALYESKAMTPITAYTLEVNQIYQVAKQYFKRDPKRAAKLVGAIWLYNMGYQQLTGNKLNADPIAAVIDAGKILANDDLDEEGNKMSAGEKLARVGGRLAGEVIDATPMGQQLVGQLYPESGFRIPFGGGKRTLSKANIFGGTNVGRYGAAPPIAAGFSNPLLLLGIPGANQLQRSMEGLNAYNAGASTTAAGNTRFDITQDPENYWRSLLLGMYGTKEGRAYLKKQTAKLSGQSTSSGFKF